MLDAPRPHPERLQRRQQSYQIMAISLLRYFPLPSYERFAYLIFLGPPTHNCHGKTKNLTAKTKYPQQNWKPRGKNKIPHGKTKNLMAKTKYLMAKPKPHSKNKSSQRKLNTSRQNQILHSKNQTPHGKSKYPRQNQSYFVFAVKYLVLPWGFWFCRDVFGFAVRYFVFVTRFLVLPWQLWATISTNLFVTKSLSGNEILKSTSHTNRLHSPSNSFQYF